MAEESRGEKILAAVEALNKKVDAIAAEVVWIKKTIEEEKKRGDPEPVPGPEKENPDEF